MKNVLFIAFVTYSLFFFQFGCANRESEIEYFETDSAFIATLPIAGEDKLNMIDGKFSYQQRIFSRLTISVYRSKDLVNHIILKEFCDEGINRIYGCFDDHLLYSIPASDENSEEDAPLFYEARKNDPEFQNNMKKMNDDWVLQNMINSLDMFKTCDSLDACKLEIITALIRITQFREFYPERKFMQRVTRFYKPEINGKFKIGIAEIDSVVNERISHFQEQKNVSFFLFEDVSYSNFLFIIEFDDHVHLKKEHLDRNKFIYREQKLL
jgi:hypothetical protein